MSNTAELPSSTTDLFAKSKVLAVTPTPDAGIGGNVATTIGGVLSAVLRTDQNVRRQMTPAEQAAVDAVIKNVGTPDEYPSAAEYVLRAVPYVRSVYSVMDQIQPQMPSEAEIAILMRGRYLAI